jgi:phosphodiesterase/alkaline phosphatase D-like protein
MRLELPFSIRDESSTLRGGMRMNWLLGNLGVAAAAIVLYSNVNTVQLSPYAQKELPPAKRTARVHITRGPELESATSNSVIIRWTSNNPGGADEHFGVVNYGTNPKNLSEMAKSHIRLNRNHSYTVFRVRVDGLKPRTTYYYTVDSMGGDGADDGVKSDVRHFTTP